MENMDAVQQNHRAMRPMIDPHHQQQQQQAGWYSGHPQFQYPGAQQQQQWAPPPPLDHYGQVLNQHYPLPPPPPQRPMPPHQVTHMYAQPDQAWANPGWSHQQPWEFAGNSTGVNNEDDWAAKARAWAAGKAAMESQQAQSQFAPVNRPAEHQVYQGHYSQPFHTQFAEAQQPSFPGLGHQSVQPHAVSAPNITANQVQDSSSRFPNDVSSSYVSDVFMSYGSKDAVAIQEENAPGISSQGSIPITTNYSQEMSMSYSSVPGFEGQAKQMPTSNSPLSSSVDLQQDEYMLQSQMHSTSTSQPTEQPHFTYSDQQEAPVPEVSHQQHQQPEFERDAQDYHQHQQSSYLQPVQTMASDGQEYNGPTPSVPGWSQLGPFSPVPPVISLNPQFEHPYTSIPHPINGHPAHLFGRVPGPQPGPGFRPNMPPIGVSFGMGPLSPSLPPGQLGMVGPAFMGDNNGAFGVPERPKKASVPNWLREELKKKAAVVVNTSAQGHASEDSFHASESDDVNQSFQKSDYTDVRSADSHRSSDDEDEEDEVEATRTAAINQEIKRVLTEVLKKVTDDLFDEIAQEVLDEDDDIIQVKKQPVSDRGRMKISRVSPPPSQVKPTTVSTKVVVSANNATAGSGEEDDDNSSSSAPGGNVLGLANYASDDEDDGPDKTQQVSSLVSEHQDASLLGEKEHRENHVGHSKPGEPNIIEYVRGEKSKDDRKSDTEDEKDNPRIKEHHEDTSINKDVVRAGEGQENLKAMLNPNTPKYMDKGSERNQVNIKSNHNDVEVEKRRSNDSKDKESRSKGFDKTDSRKSVGEVKTEEREMKNRKGDDKQNDIVHQRKDGDKGREREREKEKEKRGDREKGKDGDKGREREKEKEREKIKDREKNRAVDKKSDKEKTREREGRKDSERTHDKERKKDHTREKRATDNGKRSDRDRGERSGTGKERDAKDTGKRRKRSSSVSSRGRNSKVDSYDSNNSSSEPEGTERTRRRRLQSSRRSSSPSGSRKRQVSRSRSRSPHARHSHRRHSPYPSHDARRKRSRSGSPVHRRR